MKLINVFYKHRDLQGAHPEVRRTPHLGDALNMKARRVNVLPLAKLQSDAPHMQISDTLCCVQKPPGRTVPVLQGDSVRLTKFKHSRAHGGCLGIRRR